MVAFEVFNATLWSVILAINKIEKRSCSIQLATTYIGPKEINKNATSFLDSSIAMAVQHAIPILLTDFSESIADAFYRHLVRLENTKILRPLCLSLTSQKETPMSTS